MQTTTLALKNLGKWLFLIGIFAKQFYLFHSGSLQIGDICMILGTITLFVNFRLSVFKTDLPLYLFLLCVIVINGIYALLRANTVYLLYSSYYLFNLLIILGIRPIIQDTSFLKKMVWVLKIGLICQTLIWLTGMGTMYGGGRYMSTFNDPNQFAFFVFSSYLLLIILAEILNNFKFFWCWTALTVLLIIQSSSTGMLIGVFLCIALRMILQIFHRRKRFKLFSIIAIIGGFVPVSNLFLFGITLPHKLEGFSIIDRIEQKINKFSGQGSELNGWDAFLTDRQLHKVFTFPYYMLFGSGEGEFSRFIASSDTGEIHSTFPSMLFYYGAIPFCLLLYWIFLQLRGIRFEIWAVYIAVFLESFTLLNQRQPFFWLLLILASHPALKSLTTKGHL